MKDLFSFGDTADVYLSPHSDDVCFSLGFLAWRRRNGMLLTVFPHSGYLAGRPRATGAELDAVTRLRLAEDAEFARACNMSAVYLDHIAASDLGWPAFDAGRTGENIARIENDLLRSLLGPTIGRAPALRPWLFCPAGIGGHVDHVAVRSVVAARLAELGRYYRVAFYEDLHYASDPSRRGPGLEALVDSLAGRELVRYWWPVEDPAATKLSLLGLYRSQLTGPQISYSAFTPAVGDAERPVPHEAIWLQPDDAAAKT